MCCEVDYVQVVQQYGDGGWFWNGVDVGDGQCVGVGVLVFSQCEGVQFEGWCIFGVGVELWVVG